MPRPVANALVALAALAVGGIVLAVLVAYGLPLWKEALGPAVGGLAAVIAAYYATVSRDEAQAGRQTAQRAEIEARSSRETAQRAEIEARSSRETAQRAEAAATASPRQRRQLRKRASAPGGDVT